MVIFGLVLSDNLLIKGSYSNKYTLDNKDETNKIVYDSNKRRSVFRIFLKLSLKVMEIFWRFWQFETFV